MAETLGDESINRGKIYVFLIFMLAYGFLFYGLIGATARSHDVLIFYIWFTAILGFAAIVVDFSLKKADLPLDTVVHEDNSGFRSFKMQLIIGVVICVLYGLFISSTGSALVKAPEFGIFDSKAGEGFLSGTVGGLETLPFFTFLFPTAYAILYKRFGSLSLLLAAGIAISGFTFFHLWRYSYDIIALWSVAIFAAINIVLIYVFRSSLIPFMLHFTNNILIVLLVLQAYGFIVAV
jgi:hypothetical protein